MNDPNDSEETRVKSIFRSSHEIPVEAPPYLKARILARIADAPRASIRALVGRWSIWQWLLAAAAMGALGYGVVVVVRKALSRQADGSSAEARSSSGALPGGPASDGGDAGGQPSVTHQERSGGWVLNPSAPLEGRLANGGQEPRAFPGAGGGGAHEGESDRSMDLHARERREGTRRWVELSWPKYAHPEPSWNSTLERSDDGASFSSIGPVDPGSGTAQVPVDGESWSWERTAYFRIAVQAADGRALGHSRIAAIRLNPLPLKAPGALVIVEESDVLTLHWTLAQPSQKGDVLEIELARDRESAYSKRAELDPSVRSFRLPFSADELNSVVLARMRVTNKHAQDSPYSEVARFVVQTPDAPTELISMYQPETRQVTLQWKSNGEVPTSAVVESSDAPQSGAWQKLGEVAEGVLEFHAPPFSAPPVDGMEVHYRVRNVVKSRVSLPSNVAVFAARAPRAPEIRFVRYQVPSEPLSTRPHVAWAPVPEAEHYDVQIRRYRGTWMHPAEAEVRAGPERHWFNQVFPHEAYLIWALETKVRARNAFGASEWRTMVNCHFDVNGDGSISVLDRQAIEAFNPPHSYGMTLDSTLRADLNGDGRVDLIEADRVDAAIAVSAECPR